MLQFCFLLAAHAVYHHAFQHRLTTVLVKIKITIAFRYQAERGVVESKKR